MARQLFLLVLVLGLTMCSEDERGERCSTSATIRDLTGLDGCGFVFELEDGTRLEPVRIFFCGTPPVTDFPDDVLLNYEFVDGKKVFINYEESTSPSICMVGQTVRITCISDANIITED